MSIPVPQFNATDVTLRMMEPGDIPALREIYYSNVPDFLPEERSIFEANLNENSQNYFVIEENGKLVAGGGINLGLDGSQCVLYMGVVHREHHRKGFGTLLMLARLSWTDGDSAEVWVMTHEKVRPFYERFGFEPAEPWPGLVVHSGFGMFRLNLTAEKRAEIQTILASLPVRNLTIDVAGEADLSNLHIVNVTGPRPDFRVFISLLYGDRRKVYTDGDFFPVHTRNWSWLHLQDHESEGPSIDIYSPEYSDSFEVTSESPRLAELAAYYLFEYCGDSIQTKGKMLSDGEIATLSWKYLTELERARESVWHQSSDRNPNPY